MTDDYIATIVTVSCLGTLSNMNANYQMLDRAGHNQTERLLREILIELKKLNRRPEDGLQDIHDGSKD